MASIVTTEAAIQISPSVTINNTYEPKDKDNIKEHTCAQNMCMQACTNSFEVHLPLQVGCKILLAQNRYALAPFFC